MANVPEGRVVHPRDNDTATDRTAASGTVHNDRIESGGGETQARKPSLADFGWDFPFNSPKPTR